MPRWTRVKTFPDSENDFVVLRDRRIVGRTYAADLPHVGPVWLWFVQTYPGSQGYCDTLAEALETIREGASQEWAGTPTRWPPK